MSQSSSPVFPRRFLAAALSAIIHAGALALLLLWQFSPTTREGGSALTVVDLSEPPPPEPDPPPPPPQPEPQPTPGAAMSRAAAPPAPKVEAAPLAAAIPVQIPSFAPAPVPSAGAAPRTGAALAGSGSGAGGEGAGTGGGGTGAGGGRPASPRLGAEPEAIRGYFKRSDYPKALRKTGPEGSTWAAVMVGTNGRPLSCRITRPSGIPQFDEQTCRILMQRFRFRPGRDPAGRPVVAPWEVGVDWDYVDLNEE